MGRMCGKLYPTTNILSSSQCSQQRKTWWLLWFCLAIALSIRSFVSNCKTCYSYEESQCCWRTTSRIANKTLRKHLNKVFNYRTHKIYWLWSKYDTNAFCCEFFQLFYSLNCLIFSIFLNKYEIQKNILS